MRAEHRQTLTGVALSSGELGHARVAAVAAMVAGVPSAPPLCGRSAPRQARLGPREPARPSAPAEDSPPVSIAADERAGEHPVCVCVCD